MTDGLSWWNRRRSCSLILTSVLLCGSAATAADARSPAQGSLTSVTDDTGTFSVGAPADWTDTATYPTEYTDGTLGPTLIAAPDVSAHFDGGPGVYVSASPGQGDPNTPLDPATPGATVAETCTPTSPAAPDPAVTALPNNLVGSWACGDLTHTGAVGYTADGAYFVYVVVIGPADLAPAVLASLSYLRTDSGAAPATTAPLETEGLTITEAGDPAAPVTLRRERSIGERSTSVLDVSVSQSAELRSVGETDPYDTPTSTSSLHAEFAVEVIAENNDGSFEQRLTASVFDGTVTTNDPAPTQFADVFRPLVGLPFTVYYAPDLQEYYTLSEETTPTTDEQIQLLAQIPFPQYSFPSTPVGVGATWTAPLGFGVGTAIGTGTAYYRLDAIDGDTFTVSMAMNVDLAQVERDALTESRTGTVTLTGTITGSLTVPTQVSVSTQRTIEYAGIYSYGVDERLRQDVTLTYVATPAA